MTYYLMADSEYDSYMMAKQKIFSLSGIENIVAKDATPMKFNRGVAEIDIAGALEPERDAYLDFLGIKHTAYSDIRSQISAAVGMGAKKVVFNVNSPGGNVLGMMATMKDVASLSSAGIKTETRASGLMASAAYMIGSQSDKVVSTSESDIVGSIGVVRTVSNFPWWKDVTNHESPNKRPDANTEDGINAVKDELSDIYNVVMPHVAKARNTTIENINSNWGKGGIMTAKTALSRGMIDMIQEPKPAGRSGATNKGNAMNKEQLKAEHPDLYASVYNEGKEAGKAEFKELATAHAELAEMSGDTARALSDIKAGNDVTPSCTVHHTKMVINKKMISARDDESPAPVGDGDDAQAQALGNNEAEDVKKVYAELGLEVEL